MFHRCNDGSNCLDGNYKVISKCTIYSPTVCSGCEDGNFFDKSTGFNGGCVECSKCAFDEVETRTCSTAHDRKCEKMPSTTSEIWAPSKYNYTQTKETGIVSPFSFYFLSTFSVHFLSILSVTLIGTLRSDDGDGNENFKKAIGLIDYQNNDFVLASRFFVHFFAVISRLRGVKMPNFTEEIHKRQRNFPSLCELGYGSLEFNFRRVRLHLTNLATWSNRDED